MESLPLKGTISRRSVLKGIGVLALFQMSLSQARAAEFPSREEALSQAFPSATAFGVKRSIARKQDLETLEKRLPGRNLPRIFTYTEVLGGSEVLGYAVEGAVLGKHLMIDYIIALTRDLKVRHIEVLAYRESYGYQIRNQGFLAQFYDKKSGDTIELNKNIRNIATATISCRSMIRAVEETLALADVHLSDKRQARHSGGAYENGIGAVIGLQALARAGHSEGTWGYVSRCTTAMNTLVEITVAIEEKATTETAEKAIAAAFDSIHSDERRLSRYNAESCISRLNQEAGHGAYPIDADTFEILKRCHYYYKATHGAFNVVMDSRGSRTDFGLRLFTLPNSHYRARLERGYSVDLGGVGKGSALDRAARVLQEHGVHEALLNFGGQVLVLTALNRFSTPAHTAVQADGSDPEALFVPSLGWKIALGEKNTDGYIRLARGSLSTSSNIQRPGHLAAENLSVTVWASNAESADVASTAAYLNPGLKAAGLPFEVL